MTTFRNPRAGLFLLVLPVLLSGCISLVPKTPPAQLYRFGADPAATAPVQNTARAFAVRAQPIGFERASANDRILTVEGDKTAYIGGSRWITSASSLFEAAVDRAFADHAGTARLLARGETAAADYALKLDVRRFEVLYDHGLATAPTIKVEVYAALDNPSSPGSDREHVFQATLPAADNRVSAIVAAFNQAVDQVLGALVSWVDAKGAG